MGAAGSRWLVALSCVLALVACGDDSGDRPDVVPDGGDDDAAMGMPDAEVPDPVAGNGGSGGGVAPVREGGLGDPMDAGPDAGPMARDAAGAVMPITDAGPPPAPDDWSCPLAFWDDGYCDCGCTARDRDCFLPACTEPGCVDSNCEVCFTLEGNWKPCEPEPSPSLWACLDSRMNDLLCDCGCVIDDPTCNGSGCSEPGCRKQACQRRAGCTVEQMAAGDDCSGRDSVPSDWTCALDRYASGDGCDCGCGAKDPDCDTGGCTAGRCFDNTCDRCHDGRGRLYSCDAAMGGWDEDIDIFDVPPRSKCDGTRFAAGDGCDCGCGGIDPDCGTGGCAEAGCNDAACDRCTDDFSGAPRGCGIPAAWVSAGCAPESYGTGDGCDCGCGADDPDCGAGGCTTDGCTDSGCDVCHDSVSAVGYVLCDDWTCTDPDAFSNPECDCGCGVVDPFCRDIATGSPLYTCTEAGCETAACQFCNDASGTRTSCGGTWNAAGCGTQAYGQDGRCDCGCGAMDPDCPADMGCSAPGCQAPGCDVCHGFGSSLLVCYEWTCDPAARGDGSDCDCGCGALDPDCGANDGCREPGCRDDACEVCHDPFGRVVECP